uniref:Fibronectin type-III domain-containing protein n=1 Tax=Laticauda laticaudata TaxID=8630 RepID=A0A8C5SR14_LATLA
FNLYGVSGRKRSSPISTFATTGQFQEILFSEEQFPVQPSLGEFSALDIRSDSVRLLWTISTGSFDSFLIQYKDANGQTQALSVEGSSTEVIVNNLIPSRRYKFNLYGVSGKKRPITSNEIITKPFLSVLVPFTETETEPIPVQSSLGEFSVLDVTSDTVRLYWTVSTGSFDSFLIQYKDADGQPQTLPVEESSCEVTVTNLAPSRRYKFNLYGVFGCKRSSSLSTDAITGQLEDLAWLNSKEPVPIQPSLGELSVFDVTSNSIRLYWTISTGSFDSFLIQYNNADGQPQALPIDGSSNQVTVANLVPSHRYKFNLYGVSGHKRSNPLSIDATTAHITDTEEPIPVQPSLGEFSILDVTTDSVRLHWAVPTGRFDSFLIQYKDADGQPQALPVEGGSREVTVTNLVPSRRYKFNLYGVSGRKRSSPLSTDATTDIILLLGEFSALDITSNSVRLHWTVTTGRFDSFLIQYNDAGAQPQTMSVEGGYNEVTVTDLAPSQRYKFNLYGISGRKRSSPLSTDAIPVQPSLGDFTVLDVTSNSVRLHWTVPTGTYDSFLILYKDADGQSQMLPVEGDSREVTVTNLVPSRRYKFNLYGVFGRKRSSPLSTDATTAHLRNTEEPIPVQPRLGELSVLDVTSDSVRLHWTVPTGNFESFLIQYKDADGQPQALPVEGGSNEVTVSKLIPSRRYKFNLYGISGRKRSSPLSTDATTGHVQPSLGEFSVLDVTSDSVHLHWTIPTGSFDSFLVQYKDADGQPQALPVEGGSNELTVTNLIPSRKYKFNLYGISGPHFAGSETATPPQPSLGDFSVLDVMSDSVRLHWTVPTGSFDSFLVQYKDADGQPQALPVEGESTEVTVSDLVPSRRYKFNLYGISGHKRTGPLSTDATTGQLQETFCWGISRYCNVILTALLLLLRNNIFAECFNCWLVYSRAPQPVGSTEITVTNLVPSRRYKFNLYGVSGRERSSPLSTDAITGQFQEFEWPGFFNSYICILTSCTLTLTFLCKQHFLNLLAPRLHHQSQALELNIFLFHFPLSAQIPEESIPVQPSLGEFSILDVKTDSVCLYWTVSTGAFDSFLIQYKDVHGQPQALPVEGGSREVTVTNLVPSRRYKFNLYGVSGGKRSSPLTTDATTGQFQYLTWLEALQILFLYVRGPQTWQF